MAKSKQTSRGNTENKKVEIKLNERCEVLAKTIKQISPFYKKASKNQRQFLETIIGAAIWYLPKNNREYWTHRISVNAIKNHLKAKPKLTEDHAYPRKLAAEKLLKIRTISPEIIIRLYKTKFGLFNLITSEENRKLMPFQRKENYKNWHSAYKRVGIKLLKIGIDELNRIKKRDRKTIKKILERKY